MSDANNNSNSNHLNLLTSLHLIMTL